MATTISFPSGVTDPSSTNASNAFADDGTNTDLIFSTDSDIIWDDFSSLSIPTGATINGIEIVAEGFGKTISNTPQMSVYNGTSWATLLPMNGTFVRGVATYDPAWGSNSNLWGLTWSASTAEKIEIKVDNGTLGAGRSFALDYLKVRITYTEAGYGNNVSGVTAADISKINGLETASIDKVIGV